MQYTGESSTIPPITDFFPTPLWHALLQVSEDKGEELYISGGTIRDWLLGRRPADLDLTVHSGAEDCCKKLIALLGAGALVKLGTEDEEAARVVWQGITVDFSSFRKQAQTIEEELHHRDFTINCLAIPLQPLLKDGKTRIIDPLEGRKALMEGCLYCCADGFVDDPLRMLRGYRLQAELEFALSEQCVKEIKELRHNIADCAAERICYELDRIMSSGNAARTIGAMAESGLLWSILPELEEGVGVEQPGFHHEDVFNHNLLTLQCVEQVMARPQEYFHVHVEEVNQFLQAEKHKKNLCWSALFHDLGKPETRSSGNMATDRITFYNHDRVGQKIFLDIGSRLRMSKADSEFIGKHIEMHMHPFHLSNVRRKESLSRKALLKICKKGGDELPGLFILAMADSLAGQGAEKPENMEKELAELFDEVQQARKDYIEPALHGERLLSGYDLISEFDLEPGPLFKRIFTELELAQVEEKITTRQDALEWLAEYIEKMSSSS